MGNKCPLQQLLKKSFTRRPSCRSFEPITLKKKWGNELGLPFVWKHIWTSVHNQLSGNEAIDVIWRQAHLNFYTQYSYNKWHKTNEVCPLCHLVPQSIFHIILYCDVVVGIWNDIEPLLVRLYSVPVSNEEKAFGIVKKKPSEGVLARNWLTFLMRQVISDVERLAHYATISVSKGKVQF